MHFFPDCCLVVIICISSLLNSSSIFFIMEWFKSQCNFSFVGHCGVKRIRKKIDRVSRDVVCLHLITLGIHLLFLCLCFLNEPNNNNLSLKCKVPPRRLIHFIHPMPVLNKSQKEYKFANFRYLKNPPRH